MNWKTILGYEGLYEVSDTGLVRSVDRLIKLSNRDKPQLYKGKELKQTLNKYGYPIVKLSKEGKVKTLTVHRLVLSNFSINPENKPQVNHIDGSKTNNELSNLEWVTAKENAHHARVTGLVSDSSGYTGVKKAKTVSKYHNVSYHEASSRWTASVSVKNKTTGYKSFMTEEEAAQHVNFLLDKHQLNHRPRNII